MSSQDKGRLAATETEADEISARRDWFLASRIKPGGKTSRHLLAKASGEMREAELAQATELAGEAEGVAPSPPGTGPSAVNWTPLGPSVVAHGQATSHPPVSGRIRALAVGPGGARAYAGAANGGLWFSEDGGAHWTPLDDYFQASPVVTGTEADSLAVGAVSVRFGASTATDTIYVGTGEPGAGDSYLGVGIRRSASGGAPGTWSREATNLSGFNIYRIVIDPDDPSKVLAATSAGLFQRPTSGSTASWTRIITGFTHPELPATDLIVTGAGSGKRYYTVFQGDVIYASPDGISGWSEVGGVSATAQIVLGASEQATPVVYAFRADGQLFRKVGTSFQAVAGMPAFGTLYGGYAMGLAVDPADGNTVYLMGALTLESNEWNLALFKGTLSGSDAAGWTFPFNPANASQPASDPTYVGRDIHPDGHAIEFALQTSGSKHDGSNVWIGCDGGVFQSGSSGARGSFMSRNVGLAITQLTYFDQRADTDAVVFAGCQDNGSLRFWGEPTWFESPEGDGGGVAVDPNDPYRIMRQYIYAGLYATTDGGQSPGSWQGLVMPPVPPNASTALREAADEESKRGQFYAPFAVTPPGVTPTMVAFGTDRPWVSSDWGASWVTLPANNNPYAGGTANQTQDQLSGGVNDLVFASATRLFVATFNGVWQYDKSGTTWSRTTIPMTGLGGSVYVTAIAPADPATGSLYMTRGWGGVEHVWYWSGGASGSWYPTGFNTAAVDVPAHAVVVDPVHTDTVYVGTDVGVWKGVKSGSNWSWTPFSSGLPENPITDLKIHRVTRLLRAATHGRGMWEISIDGVPSTDPDLYVRANYADTGRIAGGLRLSLIEGAPDPTAQGVELRHWMCPDIKVRRSSLSSLPVLGAQADFYDFAENIGDYVDSSTHTETVDISGVDRFFVQVHNRGATQLPGSQVRVLLLLTDGSAGLPPLPVGYASRINSGDTSNWLAGTKWVFADPGMPYRLLRSPVDARISQVVEYGVDLSALALPAGHDHVCAAAFVTTTTSADQLSATSQSMDWVSVSDKHGAHRNLHVVPLAAKPAPPESGREYEFEMASVLVTFHDSGRRGSTVDLVFDRQHFPGEFSIVLPSRAVTKRSLGDWEQVASRRLTTQVRKHLARIAEGFEDGQAAAGGLVCSELGRMKQGRLARIDPTQIFTSKDRTASFQGVKLKPGAELPCLVVLQLPEGAVPGDRFRFDVIQRRGRKIVGGSSYLAIVSKERPAEGRGKER